MRLPIPISPNFRSNLPVFHPCYLLRQITICVVYLSRFPAHITVQNLLLFTMELRAAFGCRGPITMMQPTEAAISFCNQWNTANLSERRKGRYSRYACPFPLFPKECPAVGTAL